MSDLQQIQQAATAYRTIEQETKKNLQLSKAKLKELQNNWENTKRGLDQKQLERQQSIFDKKRIELENNVKEQNDLFTSLKARFNKQLQVFVPQLNPVTAIEGLSDNYPVLLFPLRLEYRFKIINNQHQLWLRVYPDDSNVLHRELILSKSELKNAQQFWIQLWRAGGVEKDERGAWAALVNSHGSGRAAYIIKEYKPGINPPVKVDPSHQFLIITSTFTMSDAEKNALDAYWKAYWLAKGDVVKIKKASDDIIAIVGAPRASELITNVYPENLSDKVADGLDETKVFVQYLVLPEYTPKTSSWSEAPVTSLLPDKFVAILTKGATKRTELFPFGVSDHLPVGPDPSLPEEEQVKKDANGNLIVNDDLQWMVDFDKAIAAGMAMKINLTQQEYNNGFDLLKVVGVRFSSDNTLAQKELTNLLNSHFYSKNGFGLLKQGTPTNNTEDLQAGYSWIDNPDESYDRIFKHIENYDETDDLEQQSDGQKLADALGISSDFLKVVPNAAGTDQLEANAMNKALFPATMGYFMEEMMHPLFTEDDIRQTKSFFANYVSGRGPVPAIRIGKQPYGILPVSVYSRLSFPLRPVGISSKIFVQNNFLTKLYALLRKLDTEWKNMMGSVPHVSQGSSDPHQVLLDVVGLHPNSVEFHQRYSQTLTQLYNQLALQAGPLFGGIIASAIANRGKVILEKLGIDATELKLPILNKFFFGIPNDLSGPLIDDVPDSEINMIRAYSTDNKNYIEWLATSGVDKIRMEDFGGNDAPTALLYILLRHALMLAQSDSATRFLVNTKQIKDKTVFFDPDLLHVQQNETGKSKLEALYSSNPVITGDDNLLIADYIYKPEVLEKRNETIRLNETLDALNILKTLPTARLERLFSEHIDCCNYRLDAWFTALVQFNRQEQRSRTANDKNPGKGLYLGAYGWLLDVKSDNKILQPVQLSGDLAKIFGNSDGSPVVTDTTNLGYIHAPSINQAATAAILRNAYDSNKGAGGGNPFAINLSSDRVRIADSFLEGIRNGQSLAALLGYYFERGLHDKHNLGKGEVDKFIYPLRKVFPLVLNKMEDTKTDDETSKESIEAGNVIDGLKLIQHVQNSSVKTYPYGLPDTNGLPDADQKQTEAIDAEVKAITEIHDAIGDLVLSEQVYQTVLGNVNRAAGNADAFSKGNYPPDVDVMDTPRTGITLTHRMAIQFNALATSAVNDHPRTKAEPALSEWLKNLLPSPSNIQTKLTWSSPTTPETPATVTLQDIGLDSMDLLYILQTDTEQAMTELDDRITNYIRYTISKHPDTNVFIQYTEIIDETDRSKVSFFELSSLMNALRRILRSNRYLQPSHLALSQAGETVVAPLNDVLLKQRINEILDSLQLKVGEVNTLQSGVKSISSLTADFESSLNGQALDASLVASIIAQMQQDLKDYLTDPSSENKTAMTGKLEAALGVIANPATVASLKTEYGNVLDNYSNDFINIDLLVKSATEKLQEIALFMNNQTGTGFMHQVIRNVYTAVFEKCNEVIKRWEEKKTRFDTLMAGYNPAGVDEEQFALLQKAEQIISIQITTPLPSNFTDYKVNHIDVKKSAFDAILASLKSHASNNKTMVVSFLQDIETSLANFSEYDEIKFDQKLQRNDCAGEKLFLVTLKEDIVTALQNVQDVFNKSITDAGLAIAEADATTVNGDKVTALLKAGKALLGDDAVLIPQFTLGETAGNEMEKCYQAGLNEDILSFSKNKDKRLFPIEDWLCGVARVKEKVHDWEHITFLSEAFNHGASTELVPLQFPFVNNDRWLALKFRDETDALDKFTINGDKLLYTAHFAQVFSKTGPQCGILIDDWTEVIPNESETTGITFHYDQPNSEPSQAMLLLVPPEIKGHWQWNDIVDALDETLEMAKKRAVEPAMIEGSNLGQFLPSTMTAVTRHWITIAANLSMNNNIYKQIKTQ